MAMLYVDKSHNTLSLDLSRVFVMFWWFCKDKRLMEADAGQRRPHPFAGQTMNWYNKPHEYEQTQL